MMNLYRITDDNAPNDGPWWAGTMRAAQERAKQIKEDRGEFADPYIDLVHMPVDKGGMLNTLAHDPVGVDLPALRTWKLSPRGGLRDVSVQDDES